MKIRKLLTFFTFIFIPCALPSCISPDDGQKSNDSNQEINYNSIDQMNSIFDWSQEGKFVEYEDMSRKENFAAFFKYEAEGGYEYVRAYCPWAIGELLVLNLNNYFKKNPLPKEEGEENVFLTKDEGTEWLNNCLEILEEKRDEVLSTLYITITHHVRNIEIESIRIIYS